MCMYKSRNFSLTVVRTLSGQQSSPLAERNVFQVGRGKGEKTEWSGHAILVALCQHELEKGSPHFAPVEKRK